MNYPQRATRLMQFYFVDGKKIKIIALSHTLYLYEIVVRVIPSLSTLFHPRTFFHSVKKPIANIINEVLLNKSIPRGDHKHQNIHLIKSMPMMRALYNNTCPECNRYIATNPSIFPNHKLTFLINSPFPFIWVLLYDLAIK